MPITCPYCKRDNFLSEGGKRRHIFKSRTCYAQYKKHYGINGGKLPAAAAIAWNPAALPISHGQSSSKARQLLDKTLGLEGNKRLRLVNDQEDNAFFMVDNDDGEYMEDDNEMQENAPATGNTDSTVGQGMRNNFRQYLQKARTFAPFQGSFADAISLLHTLRQQKCSLDSYESVSHWHFVANRDIRPHEKLSQAPNFWSRDKIYAKLRERYNRAEGYGNITEIVLPSNYTKARIVWNDAQMVIQSLLTDPRITAKDYLFFDSDPFAPPPEDLNYIADMNTGKCYIDTYNDLITNPQKQILVPTILYVDGTVTGQFVDLPITAVQIALGIHTRVARDKAHCWGTLGYIPDPSKVKSHGKRQLIDSGHVAQEKDSDASDKSSEESDSENPTGKVKNIFRMKKPHQKRYTLEESFVSSLNSWPICFFYLPMLTILLPLFSL